MMRVYHGGYAAIETVNFAVCKPHRDFGRGFYVTSIRRHAERWAAAKGRRFGTEGAVTEFDFSYNLAQEICKIKRFEGYNEEWLGFVIMNRNADTADPAHDYDIVEGPVADDKVQYRIEKYLAGQISQAQFLQDLTYHEDTHQICFCTLVSLQTLKTIPSNAAFDLVDIGIPILEALMADLAIDEAQAAALYYSSAAFARLADPSTGLARKTWQEIYLILRRELSS